ncbi:MAG TPA: hypothetical protein VLW45_10925 [Pelomicrobium sp.]|nr:hypothetical protein [Pelomicrobium sp.]
MNVLLIRAAAPLTVTVYHARNEFASDGDSPYLDAAGQPSDAASEVRRVDAEAVVEFADTGALRIDGAGEVELENRSDANLDVRGRFQRLDASADRGLQLAPGACWRVRLVPGQPLRIRRPSAADTWLRGLWRRWRGMRA